MVQRSGGSPGMQRNFINAVNAVNREGKQELIQFTEDDRFGGTGFVFFQQVSHVKQRDGAAVQRKKAGQAGVDIPDRGMRTVRNKAVDEIDVNAKGLSVKAKDNNSL